MSRGAAQGGADVVPRSSYDLAGIFLADFGRTSWQNFRSDFAARTRRFAADEGDLRQRIWKKLKREAANIPFVEDALTAHYCAFDRETPLYVKLALVGAVVYFIVPDDLIPDSIPVLGYAYDAAVLAGAMKLFFFTHQAGAPRSSEGHAGANAASVDFSSRMILSENRSPLGSSSRAAFFRDHATLRMQNDLPHHFAIGDRCECGCDSAKG